MARLKRCTKCGDFFASDEGDVDDNGDWVCDWCQPAPARPLEGFDDDSS